MTFPRAILLVHGLCNRKHFSVSTEKTYTHWLRRFGLFLKTQELTVTTPEQKMEAFLTRLAAHGAAASTQNQAFNSLLFAARRVTREPAWEESAHDE